MTRKTKWGRAPGNPTPEQLTKFKARYPGLPDFLYREALVKDKPTVKHGKRSKFDPADLVVSSFAISTRPDGVVTTWVEDNAVGTVMTGSFTEACDKVVEMANANLPHRVKAVADPIKPLRVHLVCADNPAIIVGVISGFTLIELLGSGVVIKRPVDYAETKSTA
jgi:hypothetical protein